VFPYHFTRHQTREEHRQHIENRQLETAWTSGRLPSACLRCADWAAGSGCTASQHEHVKCSPEAAMATHSSNFTRSVMWWPRSQTARTPGARFMSVSCCLVQEEVLRWADPPPRESYQPSA
jgi:hypothetical protein